MNVMDQQVTHIKFGSGRVVGKEDGKINVLFSSEIGEKSFQYPEAFAQFLQMDSPDLQDLIVSEYQSKQEQLLREEAEQLAVILAERKTPEKPVKSSKKKTESKKKR
ncbi:hypothetical protein BBD42_28825 [Paenibacillus sp. BIHB 4019]|uniref:Uncharacterized protein n=1 Tax=Paenibacillus sp. BIHB 4019 TaxID=1870819 RepID=A0A1B2DQS0_9BACL|nr:hypothetical protein [Paenibacillus sp. BIHB 4019]ANY70056.1 hypothetical protein BBD42_28825 [Paenibacillus sp. BIHB 4019]